MAKTQNEEQLAAPGQKTDYVAALAGLGVSNKTMSAVSEAVDKDSSNEESEEAEEEETPEVEDAEENVEEVEEEEEENSENEEEEEEEDPANKKEKKDAKKKDPKKDKKEAKDVKPNALGLSIKKKATEKKPGAVIEKPEDILEVVEAQFGQKLKDITELPKFFESVNKFRADSQMLAKVSKEKEDILSTIQGLPEELLDAVQLAVKGEDYTKALVAKPKLDFTKAVDKHDEKELINIYFPGEFTADDFSDEAPAETKRAIKVAKLSSIDKYNAEKKSRENKRAEVLDQSEKQVKLYKESVAGSVSVLKQAFPNVSKEALTSIEETLSSGAVMEQFFNPNGTVKPEAARRLMMALHGEDVIADLMEAAKHVAETEVNETILERGAQKPKPKKGKGVDKLSEEVQKAVSDLTGGLNVKKTF